MSNTVYIEKRDIGATLSCWIYCGFWQMFAAEKIGLRSYINWPRDAKLALQHYWDSKKFQEIPNMYEWYFEQPMFDAPPLRERVWPWEGNEAGPQDMPLEDARRENFLYGSLSQAKEFYRKYLRFNAAVRGRGDAIIAKYGIDFTNTMGVMWRGTESHMDGRPRIPIETYYPFIDDVLAKEPDLRILATAEEQTIIDPLLRRYPKAFKVDEFFMSPYGKSHTVGDNPERFANLSGYEKGMQPAVMMYLFSKCKHLIKNRSTVSCIASWLSYGRTVSLAHPENLGHGFDITKAEIEGQIVPLYR